MNVVLILVVGSFFLLVCVEANNKNKAFLKARETTKGSARQFDFISPNMLVNSFFFFFSTKAYVACFASCLALVCRLFFFFP
jgi:hypothetical protein